MTVNLLSQRLKAAKRELTALKTAHIRGLGELNVFKTIVEVNPSAGSSIALLTITLNFNSAFAPYPFINVLPIVDNSFNHSAEWLELSYSNSGRTAIVEFLWIYDSSLPNQNIYFMTTAPVTSSSYAFRSL